MCGLRSKLKLLDFEEFIQKYKLIFLTETKLDELDDIDVPNYKIFTNNWTIKKRASGGVAILVHNSLSDYVTVLDTDIKSTIWIRLNKNICQIPIVFGLIYNPPENSPYADISIFDQIEGSGSLFRQVVVPTGRYSDKQVVIPTGRYSDRSIFRQVVIPTGRYSDKQVVIPTGR